MNRCLASLVLATMLAAAPAYGQETAADTPASEPAAPQQNTANRNDPGPGKARIAVELNKLDAVDNACRAYLVVENKTDEALKSLRLDLVMFDPEHIVAKRLAIEAAPLPADKTTLKVFDIQDLQCDGIGRILLNDVLACRDANGKRADCLESLAVSSRGDTPLAK